MSFTPTPAQSIPFSSLDPSLAFSFYIPNEAEFAKFVETLLAMKKSGQFLVDARTSDPSHDMIEDIESFSVSSSADEDDGDEKQREDFRWKRYQKQEQIDQNQMQMIQKHENFNVICF